MKEQTENVVEYHWLGDSSIFGELKVGELAFYGEPQYDKVTILSAEWSRLLRAACDDFDAAEQSK